MKIKIKFLLLIAALTLISCKDDQPLLEVNIEQDGDLKNVTFVPNMQFNVIRDSAFYYFEQKDYERIMAADITIGEQLYKSNKFDLRVFLRKYQKQNRYEYEFVLRTFSKDFKIIESYILSNTAGDISCEGTLDNDLMITKSCSDGTSMYVQINEYGKFIEQ
jgi:hypothetical protein